MYEVAVERDFPAHHAITIGGDREPSHLHRWHVCVVVAGSELDADGLLCDFHVLQERLDCILAPWQGRDLNEVTPFDRLNPTAEHVARHIAEAIGPGLPQGVHVSRVSVTEAERCTATYRPA